jgi:hypothetical protein
MSFHAGIAATTRRWWSLSPTRAVAGLVISAAAVACSDMTTGVPRPITPNTASSHRDVSDEGLMRAQGLLRTAPLAQTVVVVKTLSRGGGGINVPGTDFQLQVPNGAFAEQSMTFTITAYAGNVVAYDFQPHGVTFLKPLKAVQQLSHTNWKTLKLPNGTYAFTGAYFADVNQVDWTSGQALVNELMPSTYQVGGSTMTWSVPHFSGYLVAAGRDGDNVEEY